MSGIFGADLFLMRFYPYFMLFLFLATILLLLVNRQILKSIQVRNKGYLIALLLFSLSIRLFLIPHKPQIYFDEFHGINAASNIADGFRFFMCGYSANDSCLVPILPLHPPLFPFILGSYFMLAGQEIMYAFYLSSILGSLSVLLIFLVSNSLTKNEAASLWSAFIFSIIPMNLKFSGTAELHTVSIFFILFALLAVFLAYQARTKKMWLLAIFAVGLAGYTRMDAGVLLLLVVMPLVQGLFWGKASRKGHAALFICSVAILIPYFVQLAYAASIVGVYSPLSLVYSSYGYFLHNLWNNIKLLFDGTYAPFWLPLLALTGFFHMREENRGGAKFLGIMFLLLFVFTSLFYEGKAQGTQIRYALKFYVPLSILAGSGIYYLFSLGYRQLITIIFFALLLASPLQSKEFIKGDLIKSGDWPFLVENIKEVPADCQIVSDLPFFVLSFRKIDVIPTDYALKNNIISDQHRCLLYLRTWLSLESTWSNYEKLTGRYSLSPYLTSGDGYGFYALSVGDCLDCFK